MKNWVISRVRSLTAHTLMHSWVGRMENIRKFRGNGDQMPLGNNLTLEELSEIEEMAHRSRSREAEIILRLSAALREAMQVRESAIALMKRLQ